MLLSSILNTNVFAATIGQQLINPEAGWQRIDDRDSNLLYFGNGWATFENINAYNGTFHNMPINPIEKGVILKFKFFGTKLRFIGAKYTDYTSALICVINGVEYPAFSANGANQT